MTYTGLLKCLVAPGIVFLTFLLSPLVSDAIQSTTLSDNSVLRAVAPNFPPLAVAAKASGAVLVEVEVKPNGDVSSAGAIDGPKLLRKSAELAAKRWRFNVVGPVQRLRKVRLTFTFTLMPKDTPSEDLTPIFKPPYAIEVRENPARIVPSVNQ